MKNHERQLTLYERITQLRDEVVSKWYEKTKTGEIEGNFNFVRIEVVFDDEKYISEVWNK